MKLLTQKLEEEKDIFREPIKSAHTLRNKKTYWMRGNQQRNNLERLVSKGGTRVRYYFMVLFLELVVCRLLMNKIRCKDPPCT